MNAGVVVAEKSRCGKCKQDFARILRCDIMLRLKDNLRSFLLKLLLRSYRRRVVQKPVFFSFFLCKQIFSHEGVP